MSDPLQHHAPNDVETNQPQSTSALEEDELKRRTLESWGLHSFPFATPCPASTEEINALAENLRLEDDLYARTYMDPDDALRQIESNKNNINYLELARNHFQRTQLFPSTNRSISNFRKRRLEKEAAKSTTENSPDSK